MGVKTRIANGGRGRLQHGIGTSLSRVERVISKEKDDRGFSEVSTCGNVILSKHGDGHAIVRRD